MKEQKDNQCGLCGCVTTKLFDGMCWDCKVENDTDQDKMNILVKCGHTYHCSNRQVYGDGECECNCHDGVK